MFKSFFFMMLIFSFLIFIKFYNYVLMILISLEFIIISMYMYMYMYLIEISMEWFLIYFILISVCESVIGLTLTVKMVNFYGNQNMNNLNLLWY